MHGARIVVVGAGGNNLGGVGWWVQVGPRMLLTLKLDNSPGNTAVVRSRVVFDVYLLGTRGGCIAHQMAFNRAEKARTSRLSEACVIIQTAFRRHMFEQDYKVYIYAYRRVCTRVCGVKVSIIHVCSMPGVTGTQPSIDRSINRCFICFVFHSRLALSLFFGLICILRNPHFLGSSWKKTGWRGLCPKFSTLTKSQGMMLCGGVLRP